MSKKQSMRIAIEENDLEKIGMEKIKAGYTATQVVRVGRGDI